MCLIVDANVATKVFSDATDVEFAPVKDWLFSEKHQARIAIGGKLRTEILQIERVRKAFLTLSRAGRVRDVGDALVDAEAERLDADGLMISNDSHVVALARVSGARLLCSEDKALHTDFKNANVLRPKGKIYQDSTHRHLLTRRDICLTK